MSQKFQIDINKFRYNDEYVEFDLDILENISIVRQQSDPIPEEQITEEPILEKLIVKEPHDLNQARFLQLHSSDLLERQISPNVEFWIQNNFLYLTKYKHK
jgi:hypothetical protein